LAYDSAVGARKAVLALPAVAAAVSVALYAPQALQLFFLGFENYEAALPLAGLLFVWVFIGLRRKEFAQLLNTKGRSAVVVAAGATMAVAPLVPILLHYPLAGSFAYAGVAIATCWVGVMVVLEPNTFRFLLPYLAAYLATVGTVTTLTNVAGDPLAYVVAYVGSAMTSVSGLPVHWSSVFFSFTGAGGNPVNLYVSQGCSGTVSVSIFLLLMGLMYLDVKERPWTIISLAFGGALLFVFLNALRVVTIAVGGIFWGVDLQSGLHQWVGYAYYAMGYSLVLFVYSRSRGGQLPRLAEVG
jgi:exosortase/archaeosortase family protein